MKSVGIMTFPIYGKIKNAPNHQPVIDGDTLIDIDGQVMVISWDFSWDVMGFFLDSMGFNGIEKDLMGFSHAVKPFINPNDSPQMGGTRPPKLEVYGMCRTQHDQNVSFRKVDSSSKKCGC